MNSLQHNCNLFINFSTNKKNKTSFTIRNITLKKFINLLRRINNFIKVYSELKHQKTMRLTFFHQYIFYLQIFQAGQNCGGCINFIDEFIHPVKNVHFRNLFLQ